jgi:hypothetical protein
MKYKFEKYNYFDERDRLCKSSSILLIENEHAYGEHFSTEILNLNLDYLQEIVSSLEQVLSGNLEQYDFGYEVYSIECKKETSVILDLFNDWKLIAEITTSELYEMMQDWRNYLIENSSTVSKSLNITADNLENTPFDCLFYDGLKTHKVTNQYNDWLSSTNYAVWSNSYVEIQNKRIYIIQENVKILSTFRYYDKEELEIITSQYHLKIKENNGIYYAYTDHQSFGQFQISENDQLVVVYCIEDGTMPENIFIYAVFEKQSNSIDSINRK